MGEDVGLLLCPLLLTLSLQSDFHSEQDKVRSFCFTCFILGFLDFLLTVCMWRESFAARSTIATLVLRASTVVSVGCHLT